jgi:hypothetical protein
MSGSLQTRLRPVVKDLERIFMRRLEAVVGYGWHKHGRAPSMALVSSLTIDDLSACAARTPHWHRAECATPLVLTPQEFERSLDAFPIEYGEILATSELVAGTPPFEGLAIGREDLRRACEVQVKSHLLHLRENYLEAGGRPAHIGALVQESAPAFAALIRHLARLDGMPIATTADMVAYASRRIALESRVVDDLLSLSNGDGMTSVDSVRLFAPYLAAVERLAEFVDRWRHA